MGVAAAAAAVGLLAWGRAAAGAWAFPLDDTYIHLAVARTVAEYGTWGVNPGEFASASSAPAWTALLAGTFAVVGAREWAPLAFNLVALVACALVLDDWLRAEGGRRLVLPAVFVGAALPVVAALGMEHVLHLLLALLFARRVVAGEGGWPTLALAAALPMVRYEGLFLVVVAAALFAGRGRWRAASSLVGAAAFPVVVFGAWSVLHGAAPLPNSLLMKGSLGTGFGGNLLNNLREGTAAFALLALVLLLLPVAGRHRAHGLLFAGTAALHLGFASVGWYYRYEAWLLAWGIAWVGLVLPEVRGGWRAPVALVAVVTAGLLGLRTFDAVRYFGGRCAYIHDAKVALARSLADTAPGTVIALHDIGAMAFYGRATVVDTAGLGTDEVARLSAEHRFTGETIADIAARRGAVLALATRSWMEADRPTGWEPVVHLEWGLDAERRIEPLVVYALRPEGAPVARAWLADAVTRMGGRGSVAEPAQGSGNR